jgi:hypothetical protein
MKKIIASASFLLILSVLISCGGKGSYFEQFSNDKTFTSRIGDLNKTVDEIRTQEKGELIKENIDYLEYSYLIGEDDSYVVSYHFDEQGCYEVGIYSYFSEEANAKNVVDGIKSEMNTIEYEAPKDDNFLCRWKNSDESIAIELDYTNSKRGEFIATIFANE